MEKRQIFGVFALLAVTAAVVCGAGPGPGQAQDVPPEGETVQVLAAAPVARVEGETLTGTYDFDHDGAPETVELAHCQYPDSPAVEVTDLHIVNKAGKTLWTAFAASAHAGWNSLFACTLEGGDYLLEYHPTMYQGWCDYTYRLFSLGSDGEELVLRESAVSFDINWGSTLGHSFDPAAIAAFMEEVNGLLAQSRLLLTTDEALEGMDPEHPRDTLRRLLEDGSGYPPGYTYDESASMEANLRAYAAAMEQP